MSSQLILLYLQRSNFQRQPVKGNIKSDESVKSLIKQVEVSDFSMFELDGKITVTFFIGVDWVLSERTPRVQERNWNAQTGDWTHGKPSINIEWWECESDQPIHNG